MKYIEDLINDLKTSLIDAGEINGDIIRPYFTICYEQGKKDAKED